MCDNINVLLLLFPAFALTHPLSCISLLCVCLYTCVCKYVCLCNMLSFVCVYIYVCIDWQKWRARIVHSSRIACLLMKVCEYAATPTHYERPHSNHSLSRGLCVCYVCLLFPPDTLIVSVFMCVLRLAHVCSTVKERLGNHVNNQSHNENDPQRAVCTQPPLHHAQACCD